MRGRSILAISIAAALALGAAAVAAGAQRGTFALQGGTPTTNGYLAADRLSGSPRTWNFDFWLTRKGDGSTPIQSYDLDMTRLLHVIIIGDDFRTFIHEHPAFSPSSGHFGMVQQLPAPGRYYVFADGRPSGYGQQVFRFSVNAGSAPLRARDLSEHRPVAVVDGYTVVLSGLTLGVGQDSEIRVHITKNGRPAGDLHPYLGALAHAVFVNADDLSYVHVHPVTSAARTVTYSSDAATIPATMAIHAMVMEAGTYKLWFQFRGGNSLHVATFVLGAT